MGHHIEGIKLVGDTIYAIGGGKLTQIQMLFIPPYYTK